MKNTGSIIIGIVAAAAAGVFVGMLLAPEEGGDFRRTIKTTAADWGKKIGGLLTDGNKEFKKAKNSLAEGVNDLKHDVKNAKI